MADGAPPTPPELSVLIVSYNTRDILDRCLQARKQVAAFALIVDAKSSQAKTFYEHYGFTSCTDAPMTLYLPLA